MKLTGSQKSQIKIRLRQTIKASKQAQEAEYKLVKLTESIFGCNWSDVDADVIIDTLSGLNDLTLNEDEFIEEMKSSIERQGQS